MTAGQVQRFDFGDPATAIAIDKSTASAAMMPARADTSMGNLPGDGMFGWTAEG